MLKVLVAVLVVAVVVWAIVRLLERARAGDAPSAPRRERPRSVAAPDDDPEFLWRLERERRRRQQERSRGEQTDGGTAGRREDDHDDARDDGQADEPPHESTA